MVDEGEVMEDNPDTTNRVGAGEKLFDVEIAYEGAEVKGRRGVGDVGGRR